VGRMPRVLVLGCELSQTLLKRSLSCFVLDSPEGRDYLSLVKNLV
jgi:hypothetical protein